jgi:hypothetical protein
MCSENNRCDIEYTKVKVIEETAKGIILSKKTRRKEYETIRLTHPIDKLDFRKFNTKRIVTYKDNFGSGTVLENRIIYELIKR